MDPIQNKSPAIEGLKIKKPLNHEIYGPMDHFEKPFDLTPKLCRALPDGARSI
jgi:hypothetical protein